MDLVWPQLLETGGADTHQFVAIVTVTREITPFQSLNSSTFTPHLDLGSTP